MGPIEVPTTFEAIKDNYTAREFSNTRYIEQIHSRARPGRTNEILDLISGSNEEKKEYVKGLVISSCVIFLVFLIWTFILFGFKCLGRKRVGFLAGYPIRKPKVADSGKTDELEKAPTPSNDHCESSNMPDKEVSHGVPASEEEEEEENAEKTVSKEGSKHSLVSPSEEFFDAVDQKESDVPDPDEREQSPMEAAAEDELELDNKSADASDVIVAGDEFHDEANESSKAGCKEAVRAKRLLIATRSIVLFCCVGIIVASILFLVEGVDALVKTVDSTLEGIQNVHDVADRGVVLIDRFIYSQHVVINSTKLFLESHETWCPNLHEQCDVTTENCNLTAIPLHEELDEVAGFLNTSSGVIYDQATDLRSDLEEISDIADNLYNTTENFNIAFYVSAAFIVLLVLVILVFMYGVVQAWKEKQTKCFGCIRIAVLVPLMLFFMLMGWLFAIVFMIGAMTSADYCVDSPDEPTVAIVESMEDRFNSVVHTYIIYLLQGCSDVNLLSQSLESAFSVGLGILELVHALVTAATMADEETIKEICGVDMTRIASIATLLDEQFHVIVDLLFQIRVYFSCANFRPIYEALIYDAVCYSGVKGLTWIFSTQLAIAILCMVIASLRGSCKNAEEKEV